MHRETLYQHLQRLCDAFTEEAASRLHQAISEAGFRVETCEKIGLVWEMYIACSAVNANDCFVHLTFGPLNVSPDAFGALGMTATVRCREKPEEVVSRRSFSSGVMTQTSDEAALKKVGELLGFLEGSCVRP